MSIRTSVMMARQRRERLRSQAGQTPSLPRLDVVVDRDPDNDTDVWVFVNGGAYDGAVVRVLDPGRSGGDHEWWDSVTSHEEGVPQVVRDKVEEIGAFYHDPERCVEQCI